MSRCERCEVEIETWRGLCWTCRARVYHPVANDIRSKQRPGAMARWLGRWREADERRLRRFRAMGRAP